MTIIHKWTLFEFAASTTENIKLPFWEVTATAEFVHEESGAKMSVRGFYDGVNKRGDHEWKFRWTPARTGTWQCRIASCPKLDGFGRELEVAVSEAEPGARGFMRAHGGKTWGFEFDNGESFFPLGDTIYNLFGGAYCGVNTEDILRHRRAQGVNYVRARMQVSPFHSPKRNNWQTKDCWPWLGSAQWPDFLGFNLDYFRAVDKTITFAGRMGIGLELILEAWMLEFPFNDRNRFLTEHEEHWIQYIVSRYAAYPNVYVWCPVNEYDLYPGRTDRAYIREADRWFKRLARLVRELDPFRHPIGAHQWVQDISLHERLGDCEALDVYLIQSDWFKEIEKYDRDPSLCLWIEDQLRYHAPNRDKAVMCSEFGYERAGGQFTVDAHERYDEHHTRRGMWKSGFAGFPVVHGFNNTWGPNLTLENDSEGTRYLLVFYRFMTEQFPFVDKHPRAGLVESDEEMMKLESPALCLADDALAQIAVYMPVGGTCVVKLVSPEDYVYYWYNPRNGACSVPAACKTLTFSTPERTVKQEKDSDWVLVMFRHFPPEAHNLHTFNRQISLSSS